MNDTPITAQDMKEPVILIDSNKASQAFIFGSKGADTMIGLLDGSGKPVGDKPLATNAPAYTLSVTGSKDITIDLNRAAETGTQLIEIEAKGRDAKNTTLTHFTGQPPVKIDDGAVSIQASARETFGFTAQKSADGSMEIRSNIELSKDKDGNILLHRDGQVIMTVEKDAKADFRDKDGNVILSIDGKDGLKKNQENLLAAEKKAFDTYQKEIKSKDIEVNDPDLASEKLVLKQGPKEEKGQEQAVKKDNGILGSFGSLGNDVSKKAQQEAAALQNQMVSTGVETAKEGIKHSLGIPSIPGLTGKGGIF
jgi:hypothetical protein